MLMPPSPRQTIPFPKADRAWLLPKGHFCSKHKSPVTLIHAHVFHLSFSSGPIPASCFLTENGSICLLWTGISLLSQKHLFTGLLGYSCMCSKHLCTKFIYMLHFWLRAPIWLKYITDFPLSMIS